MQLLSRSLLPKSTTDPIFDMQGADVKPAEEGTIKAILATPRPIGDEARLYF